MASVSSQAQSQRQSNVNPIPQGYHTITPYVSVADAKSFIKFLQEGLNAELCYQLDGPDGKLMHADVLIGTSHLMISEARPQWGGASTMTLNLYVEDCDKVLQQAIAAGAKSVREAQNQFYGDRSGSVDDKWGNHWMISSHVEDLAPEEIQKRAASMDMTNCG
ncbi:MAG: VOC family protein [Vampirovibrionales bacterium]|nr:VOC family protein [Vampirovibrionales bacterium]